MRFDRCQNRLFSLGNNALLPRAARRNRSANHSGAIMEIDHLALLLLLLSAVTAIGAAIVSFRMRSADNAEDPAFARRRPLKSCEQALYWRLIKTLPEHVILAQIAMSR